MGDRLHILYFAWVRDAIGQDEEDIVRPEAGLSISALLDRLAEDSAVHAEAFADRGRLRAALDQKFVPLDMPIGTARELAIFPPVTGG